MTADGVMSWALVWDILAVKLEKVHYLLPRRRCGSSKITTARPPFGAAGTVSYGPNLNAAAILLTSEGNVPIERTAMLIQALLCAGVDRSCPRWSATAPCSIRPVSRRRTKENYIMDVQWGTFTSNTPSASQSLFSTAIDTVGWTLDADCDC